MLVYTLVALQLLTLVALFVLLLRRSAPEAENNPRLDRLPDVVAEHATRQSTRLDLLDATLRAGFGDLRNAQDDAARNLRTEVTGTVVKLSTNLQANLDSFGQRLAVFINDSNRYQTETREALHNRLAALAESNTAHQERLRSSVGEALTKLNTDNAAKLEEMRVTVDEKLHATLHTRLTESFGQVTDQLNKVHTGLGEMSKLSEGVDGLSRIFTNVKSRGGVAEVLLGQLIAQTLAPNQFVHNAQVKTGTLEVVEYAVKFPGATGETLLPIDAKFPREDWERLESAYEGGIPEEIAVAGKAFESAIRTEGKRICGKYINEPVTTPYAIMFLPTESLYAEVIRRDGLQDDLQRNCHVTIAGPSTLSAILISFKMGFHMLNLQKKGDDVWKVLAATRTEFEKFGGLMQTMENQVGTVQNTIQKLGVRTRAINRTLRDVSETDGSEDNLLSFDAIAPRLAAGGEED